MNDFKFYIPLKKDLNNTLIGIASTTSIDRDSERMSDKALKMMVDDIKAKGVNLFGNHEHSWENTLGAIREAELDGDGRVAIKINLDNPNTNPKIPMLLNKLASGINLGLSVGGQVMRTKEEWSKEAGKKVKVLDMVKILEVSVVGIPSNADAFISLPQAIAKSCKEHLYTKTCPICLSEMTNKCNTCFYNE